MSWTRTRFLRSERLTAVGSALAVVGALAAAPLILWHRVFGDILGSFQLTLSYLATDLGPWLLLAAGVACLLPVALSVDLDPESRFYPRSRSVYFMWGVVLYLLGIVLVIQLYDLWNYGQ
ncbi:MAG: hypothetical protein ACJ764_08190 [Solirubrobacteraceae bacterium]